MNELSIPATRAPINALDYRGLADIQRQTKSNDPKALKAAAQQFEALFVQMVLKSMRDATPKEGMFDNEQSRMYESLLDQQLAQVMSSKKGIGLADVIERQLKRQGATPSGSDEGMLLEPVLRSYELLRQRSLNLPTSSAVTSSGHLRPDGLPVPPAPTFEATPGSSTVPPANAREFISRMLPEANAAAQETGVPAGFLIAHAALETGWGRSEPRGSDGRPSYNLFGIKAGRNWTGDSVEASTTEYVQGVPQRRTERFRAYGSYAEAFRDYAQLLTTHPRYANVVGAQDASRFARGLQAAGYATDPAYASKLERVIGAVTSTTG
jgi:flagellar protein FlgJ